MSWLPVYMRHPHLAAASPHAYESADAVDALVDVLDRTFRLVAHRAPIGVDAIRLRVRAYAEHARASGEPVERVIIALKEIVSRVVPPRDRTSEQRALAERVVSWCIRGYYRAD
jgi:hypothetical protein